MYATHLLAYFVGRRFPMTGKKPADCSASLDGANRRAHTHFLFSRDLFSVEGEVTF